MSARTRELFGLLPVSLLVVAGFAAVLATRTQDVQDATLTYGAVFLGLCVVAHLFIRARLPDADPYLFPLAALLAAVGLVLIYRIDPELAREQAQWFVVGLIFFCGTILLIRDHHVLERYRYLIAAASIALLALPRLPGIGAQVNGAFLAIELGPIKFQPAEFAKLGIIIFLASYLRETGDILVRPRLRPLPFQRQLLLYGVPAVLTLLAILVLDLGPAGSVLLVVFVASLVAVLRERPSPKHFGPLLLVWGLAMLMLIFIRDLGSSLMFFGGFLALLYVATGRLSLVGVGVTMFFGGAFFFAERVSHVRDRFDIWLDTFSTERVTCPSTGQVTEFVNCQGYQVAQSLFAQADGGLFGEGFGRSLLEAPGGNVLIPAPHTDLIYSVLVNEAGLFGAAGLVGAYLLLVFRGFKISMVAADGFSKLLAVGLTSVLALQVFVIVGGVTRVIPLTGVTLPLVSYGGSSLLANLVLLALLLIVSDSAGVSEYDGAGSYEPPDRSAVRPVRGPVRRARGLHLVLERARRRGPRGQPEQPPRADPRAEDPARPDPRERRPHRSWPGASRAAAARTASTRAPIRPEGCSRTPSATRTSATAGSASSARATTRSRARRTSSSRSSRASRGASARASTSSRTSAWTGTQAAQAALGGRKGAVVAIEPQTGKVRVMVSIPEYDANLVPTDFGRLNTDPNKPLLNRTTQELYPPGSTFKVVTATAALDSGKLTPESIIDGSSPKEISGVPLVQRRRHELRADLVHRRAHQLRQHRLRADRRADRPPDARRVHEALRLLRGSAARLSRRADDPERHHQRRRRLCRGWLRRRACRDRPGWPRG